MAFIRTLESADGTSYFVVWREDGRMQRERCADKQDALDFVAELAAEGL
jgi:hypothetical protein